MIENLIETIIEVGNKITDDYVEFLKIAPANQIILVVLFFIFPFIFSISTFILPLRFPWFYKRMEGSFSVFQITALFFYGVWAWRVYSFNIDPHFLFVGIVMAGNIFFNWWLYDKVTKDAARRLQFQKNGISSIETRTTLSDIKKEESKHGHRGLGV